MIGDLHTAAMVGRDGSIDWWCVPRFDDGAVFAKLLGEEENGFWRIAPVGEIRSVSRRYRGETLILETDFTTDTGILRVTDVMPVMPLSDHRPRIGRLVECVRGNVRFEMDLRMRFDYGSITPWVRRLDGRVVAIAGPNALVLDTPVKTHGRKMATTAEVDLAAGQSVPFMLSWQPSAMDPQPAPTVLEALDHAEQFWTDWISGCTYEGDWRDPVRRSLVTLKALTYAPTGGLCAAATTSLPEQLGGTRNWDYRFCWLRDASITLQALLASGFEQEAAAWREWLLRAIAGDPSKLQIMYGLAGERRLDEWEVPWLGGFEGSAPVRVGNAAVEQRQLDVYGEVIQALYIARESGLHHVTGGGTAGPDGDKEMSRSGGTKDIQVDSSWPLQRKLLDFLEGNWREPDEGIWEVRGPQQHFVHSKVMAWVAMDRAVHSVEDGGLHGPVDTWRRVRAEIHAEVLDQGYDAERRTFTQYYGSKGLDAATLMVPLVGFLPADDPRVVGTRDAVSKHLTTDGFVRRYDIEAGAADGLTGTEGAFLMCTSWLADNYSLAGDTDRAREMIEQLFSLRNDVGLLAEEYDPVAKRQLGNMPQAFSHVALVNSAHIWSQATTGRSRRDPARGGHARSGS